jgi:RNA polymerase sigma-70 factor (ECF subfamily)
MIEELYDSYFEELLKWCTMMTREKEQAEDLVQEGFLRAMDNEEVLSGLSKKQQRSWLYRTIRHLYIDKIRHSAYETVTETFSEEGSTMEELEVLLYKELLLELPEEERLMFVMRYLEGYNSKELGEFWGLSPGTIRSKLFWARNRLKKALMEKND